MGADRTTGDVDKKKGIRIVLPNKLNEFFSP